MSLFAITFDGEKPTMIQSLAVVCPINRAFNASCVVAKFSGSAQELFKALNIPDNERHGVFITQIQADYYGLANKAFWDWLSASFAAENNG